MPTLASGMVPKMGACLRRCASGVPARPSSTAASRTPCSLELFTDEGVGTQVLPGVDTKIRKARDIDPMDHDRCRGRTATPAP